MYSQSDTIAARITAPGSSAVGVIRVSGKEAIPIVAEFFQPSTRLTKAKTHTIHYGTIHTQSGIPLDEVLVSIFRSPNSYTGEDCVEISAHGNPHILSQILENLLGKCRMAEAGEFTQRAYLNGKIDLSQAEAVNDLINAKTSKSESSALAQLKGHLATHLKSMLQRITNLRIKLELMIDFGDQDLPQIDESLLASELLEIISDLKKIYQDGARGKYIRDGIKLCLAGAPNAGKSSVFNSFLDAERAIVTPHPGTTRDYLEEIVSLCGYALVIYDTAGIRNPDSDIEKIGIDRTHALMQEADLILYLIDYQRLQDIDIWMDIPKPDPKIIYAINKIDLAMDGSFLQPEKWQSMVDTMLALYTHNPVAQDIIRSSMPCTTMLPDGLSIVKNAILERLDLHTQDDESPLITNTRHLAALSKSLASIENAQRALISGNGYEFVAFDLIESSSALEEILGVITPDDILEQIFSSFCIGK